MFGWGPTAKWYSDLKGPCIKNVDRILGIFGPFTLWKLLLYKVYRLFNKVDIWLTPPPQTSMWFMDDPYYLVRAASGKSEVHTLKSYLIIFDPSVNL